MTLLEYITDLQSQGLSGEEIFAKAQEFKGRTKPKEIVEEVKTKVVADPMGAAVTTPEKASEITNTESELEDTSLELPDVKQEITQPYYRLNSNLERDWEIINARVNRFAEGPVPKEYLDRSAGKIAPNNFIIEQQKEIDNEEELNIFDTQEDIQKLKTKDKTLKENKTKEEDLFKDLEFADPEAEANFLSTLKQEDKRKEEILDYDKNKEDNVQGYIDGYIKENDLDITFPHLYFNQDKNTGFIEEYYGSIKEFDFGINEQAAIDFEGFLSEKGYAEDFLNAIDSGEYDQGEAGKLAKERDLRSYLDLYLGKMNLRLNQAEKLKVIKKDIEKDPSLGIVARNNIQKLIVDHKPEEASYTMFSNEKKKQYISDMFPISTKKDKEYEVARIKYAKELDERGDVESAVANVGTFLKEVGVGAWGGVMDLVDFGIASIGLDTASAIDQNLRLEKQKEKDSSFFMSIRGKTITKDGVIYSKDAETGEIYNVSAGYNVNGVMNPFEIKNLNTEIEKETEYVSHDDWRGYMTVGGNVVGNVMSQLVGQKGVGYLSKAVKLRALAAANGFTSVKKYKNTKRLAELIGGKVPSRMPIKKTTVDAMLFQSAYGGAIGYKNTLDGAKLAGFTDAEAEALASSGSQSMAIWYAATGPLNTRTGWLDGFGAKQGIKNIVNSSLLKAKQEAVKKGTKDNIIKSFSDGLQLRLLGISNKLATKGVNFVKEGSKETLQENTQQAGEYLWINKKLNQRTGINFLQDTYTANEIKATSILSFGTGGLLSQLQLPSFKPNSEAQISNYIYLAQNSDAAEVELNNLVENGLATQEEADQIMFNAKSVFNHASRIPVWMLKGSYTLDAANVLQEISDIELKKKNIDPAFHQSLNNDLKELNNKKDNIAESAVKEITDNLKEGSKKIAGQLNTEFKSLNDKASVDLEIKSLTDQGGIIDKKQSGDYGIFVDLPPTEANPDGRRVIVINQEQASKDNVMTTDTHETGHAFLYQTLKNKPKVAEALAKALLAELETNENITFKNQNYKIDLMQYVNDANYSDSATAEEAITLLSEALINGDVVFNETAATKLGDFIRRAFSAAGVRVRFNNGKDVLNFVRDFNNSVETKKGLSLGQLYTGKKGGKGSLTENQDNTEADIKNTITKASLSKKGREASQKVQEIYETSGTDGAFEIIEQFGPIVSKIVEKRKDAPNFDRQLLTDEINTGKRGIIDLIKEYDPAKNKSLAAFVNTFLPSRAIEASKRVLGEEFTTDVTEANNITAAEEEIETAIPTKTRKIKPSSFLSPQGVSKIKEEIKSKLKDIPVENMTFKRLGNLAPQVIADEIGIPVAKLLDPKKNLNKAEATAIQQFVTKNADRLLKLLPEGAVLEAASDKLIGTSTGVPKGLLDIFYTKQPRNKKGAGLATQKLNNNIDKASFLEAFGIVDGKKQEGFSARSSQAQALKGIASLYGRLVTNELVREDSDLKLETKQDVAAGKSKSMSKKKTFSNTVGNIFQELGLNDDVLVNDFNRYNYDYNSVLDSLLKDSGVSRMDMNTKPGRDRFLNFAIESGLTKKLPPSFWISLAYTSENALTDDIIADIDQGDVSIDRPSGSIVSKDDKVGDLREYKGNLPFKNTAEARTWITNNKSEFAAESDSFSDMLNQVGVFAKKNNLENELNNPDFVKSQDNSIDQLGNLFEILQNEVMRNAEGDMNFEGVAFVGALLSSSSAGTNHFLRKAAPYRFYEKGYMEAGSSKTRLEHTMPATIVGKYLFIQAVEGSISENFKYIKKNYFQGPLSKTNDDKLKGKKPNGDSFNYIATMPGGWRFNDNVWARYFNLNVANVDGGINPSNIIMANNDSVFDKFSVTPSGLKITNNQKPSYNKAPKLNTRITSLISDKITTQQQVYDLNQLNEQVKIEKAKSSKTKQRTFDKIFNDILESSTGIETYKEFSKAKAQTVGANKGKRTFLTTPSAEDFVGLLYKTLGKGKVGDAQFQFYKDNLIDPYNRAELAVTEAKIAAANDYKALKKNLKTLPKSLSKQTGIGGFTFGQAARVAVWTRQGMTIPGLSKADLKELNDFVDGNKELSVFADELINIQKGKDFPKPGPNWLAGTITSDIINEINKVNRKGYLAEWQENIDIIFSEKNLNKMEAAYGSNYVEALKDQIARMKSGSNRPIGGSRIVSNLLDWLNNSVGAIMFLNTRSAVLQTISAVNFINWGDNNIYKAGLAFANQKQFWNDFMTLFNSPYLTERRDGLKINVSESEIADAVSESSNKPKAFLNLLLNKGFIFTRIADSFAIAAGGSTFYRNRLNALVKGGMDIKAAEKQAFDDFYDIAETNQQSSNPSKISQQQASAAGRVILAFSNTPMQYNRIIKRSSQDLINGRGDWKTNVSKIVYYAGIQNLVFNALQNALFALAFDDEEDDEKKQKQADEKAGRIANGMADSLIRGLGIQGAATVALKDALLTIYKESNKEKGSPEFDKAIFDLFGFSPPLDAKVRKLKSGANTFSWERENMKEKGLDLNNPGYLAGAQVISGLTNIPMDRAIQKVNNLRAIHSDSSENWQKVALAMGWSTWDVGLPYYGVEDKVEMTPQMILKEKVVKMAKETSTKEQKQMLLDLGLTKQEIKALKYEDVRVKKIIELQKKK